MSRFQKLELATTPEKPPAKDQPSLKDGSHFLAAATTHWQSGDLEPTLRSFSKALEYDPGNEAAWTGYLLMMAELGDCQGALRWSDKALELQPDAPLLLATKGLLLARNQQPEVGLLFSDAALEKHPGSLGWLARADILLVRQDTQAEYCLAKMAQAADYQWLHAWLAARRCLDRGKATLALKQARQATELAPTSAAAWCQMGDIQLALGMGQTAATSFQHALDLNPRLAAARDGLAATRRQGPWSRLMGKVRNALTS